MAATHNLACSDWGFGRFVEAAQSRKNAEESRIVSILSPATLAREPQNNVVRPPNSGFAPSDSPAFEAGHAQPYTVLVADDHPVVLEGLVSLINREVDLQVTAQANNGREALEKFLAQRPDVALIDLRMPVMGGVETVMSICQKVPAARIAMITSYENEEDIYRALRAGALGCILKDAALDELIGCIHAVARGKTWIPPRVGAMLARRMADRELTQRETEVLQLVAEGKRNKEIAAVFDISEATVKAHMTHILGKLKVTGRTEAINVALKRGLIRFEAPAA
jgi:two-component system, NarL family, response regulator